MRLKDYLNEGAYTYRFISGRDLLSRLYDHNEYVQQNFKYFSLEVMQNRDYYIVSDIINGNELPIGVICYVDKEHIINLETYEKKKDFLITYIDIHKNYRRKNLASILANSFFKYAKIKKKNILASIYGTKEGSQYMKPLFEKLAKKFGIRYLENITNLKHTVKEKWFDYYDKSTWDLNKMWFD